MLKKASTATAHLEQYLNLVVMDPFNVFDDSSDDELEAEESDRRRQKKRRITVKALLVSRFLRNQKKRRVKRSNLARNRRVSHTLLQDGIND
jgi:hypothetical protein